MTARQRMLAARQGVSGSSRKLILAIDGSGAEGPTMSLAVRLERVTETNSGDLPAYAAERVALGEGGPLLAEALANPDACLDHMRRFAEGRDLPPDRVQGFEYWLLAEERILGNCRIRPELIPKIELDGGHVSYDIRPSERGRGYGKELRPSEGRGRPHVKWAADLRR